MAADILFQLQPPTTKTASFSGPAYDLMTTPGAPKRGYPIRVKYEAAQNASGNNTFQVILEDSADGLTNWNQVGSAPAVTLTAAASSGEVFTQIPGTVRRYVRASSVFAGAGATPTATYYVEAMNAFQP